MLAGRAFDELEGVTEQMATRMSRVLVDGLVQGKGPRDVARDLAREIDIGRGRAEVIARTELIRAHAEGQLEALDQLGVEEVGVAVEWVTAGDDRVCELCEPLEGVVMKLDEARGMLPRHPNCRCAWVPANVGGDRSSTKHGAGAIRSAVRDSIDRGKRSDGGNQDWGPAVPVEAKRPSSIFNALANAISTFSTYVVNSEEGDGSSCGAGAPGSPGFQPGNTCAAGSGGAGDRVRSIYDRSGVEHKTMPVEDIETAVKEVAALPKAEIVKVLAKMELGGLDRVSKSDQVAAIRRKILDRRSAAQRAAMISDAPGKDIEADEEGNWRVVNHEASAATE